MALSSRSGGKTPTTVVGTCDVHALGHLTPKTWPVDSLERVWNNDSNAFERDQRLHIGPRRWE